MAAPSSRTFRRELSKIVECSVCCETYNNPRQLPCIHSYCLKCIREYCKDKCPGDAVKCPLCRTEFILPQQGVMGLPKNFFLEQLKELAVPSSNHCDVCSTSAAEAAKRKLANKFCLDCNERLCETCAEIHGRMRATKGHHLVKTDGDDESSESRVRLMRVYCDKHQDDVLKLFCFDCKTAVCMMCFVQSHRTHECSDINQVADDFRKQMTGDIRNMVDIVSRCREVLEEEKKKKVEFNNKVKEIERKIFLRADKLKQLIDQDKSQLLEKLESFKVERNEQIDNLVEEMEEHVSFVESLRTYLEQLRDEGRSRDVTQQRGTLQDRADKLMNLDAIQRAINELRSVDVSFTAATWPTSTGDLVGKISKKHVADSSSDAQRLFIVSKVQRPQQVTATLTAGTSVSHVISSEGRGSVIGVTICDENLFVLRGKSENRIEQYELKSFNELAAIRVIGFSYVNDNWHWRWCESLTSCCRNNCLYVNDTRTVFRVDLSTKGVISWPVNGSPCGLSVNSTGNVLVTCHLGNEIIEYSTRFSCIKRVRSIRLQEDHVARPLHSIQLTDGRYVVSHRGPVHGVSLIDRHGTLITSYRNSETTRQVDYPRWIVVVNDCILVADRNNNRILPLNSSLNAARELSLTVNSQLNKPHCMCFDESSGRLFVGERDGECRVLVFGNNQGT